MSRIGRLGGKTSAGRRQVNAARGAGNGDGANGGGGGTDNAPEPGQAERTPHEGRPEADDGAPPAAQSA